MVLFDPSHVMQVRSGQAGNCPRFARSQLALLFASSSLCLEPLPLQYAHYCLQVENGKNKVVNPSVGQLWRDSVHVVGCCETTDVRC